MFFFLFGLTFSNFKNLQSFTLAQKSLLIGFTGVLLVYLVAALISVDEKSWFEVQKRVALFIIPFSVLFNNKLVLNRTYINFSLKSFIIGVLLLNTISIIKTLFFYLEYGNLPFSNGPDIFKVLILDRPYVGLLNAIAVASALFLLQSKTLKKTYSYLSVLYSFFIVNLITARAAMGIIMVIIIFHILFLFKKQHTTRILTWIVLVTGVMTFVFYLNPNLQERVKNINAYEPRTLIWSSFYDIVNNDFDWVFGAQGEIEGQKLLNQKYKEEYLSGSVWKWVYKEKVFFNTHNQFFGMYLNFGIIGLLCYLVPFLTCFYQALRTKNFYLLSVTFIFFATSIVENITARQVGVYALTMFLSIALISPHFYSPTPLKNNNE